MFNKPPCQNLPLAVGFDVTWGGGRASLLARLWEGGRMPYVISERSLYGRKVEARLS